MITLVKGPSCILVTNMSCKGEGEHYHRKYLMIKFDGRALGVCVGLSGLL